MTKKDFKGGLNSLLGEQPAETEQQPKRKKGRPTTRTWEITKSSEEGTKENETRATFIVNKELLGKLKAISYWDRETIKDIVNTALQEFILNYENESGPIKPAPESK